MLHQQNYDTFNLLFSDINGVVSSKIHSPWTVIQGLDFKRGNFAVVIAEIIKAKRFHNLMNIHNIRNPITLLVR